LLIESRSVWRADIREHLTPQLVDTKRRHCVPCRDGVWGGSGRSWAIGRGGAGIIASHVDTGGPRPGVRHESDGPPIPEKGAGADVDRDIARRIRAAVRIPDSQAIGVDPAAIRIIRNVAIIYVNDVVPEVD